MVITNVMVKMCVHHLRRTKQATEFVYGYRDESSSSLQDHFKINITSEGYLTHVHDVVAVVTPVQAVQHRLWHIPCQPVAIVIVIEGECWLRKSFIGTYQYHQAHTQN